MCDILQSVREQISNIENNTTECEDIYNAADACLENMPLEIILKICSYLDAGFIINTLSKVCSRFDEILADVGLWKHRVRSKVHGYFPPLCDIDESYEDSDWIEMCIEMEHEREKWCNVDKSTKHFVIKDVHYASVDSVILVNKGNICISGGRDRCLALWNVGDIRPEVNNEESLLKDIKPTKIRHDAHTGWVWDLATDEVDNASIVYSASWDNTVKAWDISSGFECIETFPCGISALSLEADGKIVMAGLYSKKILTFDLRVGQKPVHVYQTHKGAILALTAHNNQVASISEDKTLAVYDKVAGKILKSDIKIPSEKAYPVCLSWNTNAMYIGDSKGALHFFNPKDQSFVKSYELWPESCVTEPPNKIADCYQGEATLIACSDKGEIKFMYNSNPPDEYKTIQTSTVDVTQLRYQSGILAVSTCDSALEFWIPEERFTSSFL
ncbi:F-box/WD repeat-containing protein 9-like [Danaus plexippus]|uniref:WD-repeat protein n=1 Tax=Danaus plexippus plexippus TaxID=278856 RepID=A0A212EPW5_DANPL|nr:F-box/WD repeat-containing protein 9-like [Danaus plexippus]OWR43533.1 putative WD-repeat protein [Danaus plexippus plexippus]